MNSVECLDTSPPSISGLASKGSKYMCPCLSLFLCRVFLPLYTQDYSLFSFRLLVSPLMMKARMFRRGLVLLPFVSTLPYVNRSSPRPWRQRVLILYNTRKRDFCWKARAKLAQLACKHRFTRGTAQYQERWWWVPVLLGYVWVLRRKTYQPFPSFIYCSAGNSFAKRGRCGQKNANRSVGGNSCLYLLCVGFLLPS
jgi:hypothetical protein